MVIVLPFSGGVKAYLREHGEHPPRLVRQCPSCPAQRLWHHGRYSRVLYQRSRALTVPIYRLFCPRCGQTVSLAPWFMRWHAPFGVWVHGMAVRAYLAGTSPNEAAGRATSEEHRVHGRTVRRWCTWLDRKAATLTPVLAARLLDLAPAIDPSGLSPPPTAPLRSLFTVLALIGQLRSMQGTLGVAPWNIRQWTTWVLCRG